MAQLQCRAARKEDLPELVAMLADDFLGKGRGDTFTQALPQSYYDAFAAIHANPHQSLIVAQLDLQIVGCYQLSLIPGLSYQGAWKAIIEAVRIASPWRGQGLGRQLLAHAIDLARSKGARSLELTTHKQRKDAQRFYDGLGFKNSHEGYKLEL